MYVYGSPLNYSDPTGHIVEDFNRMQNDPGSTSTSIPAMSRPKDSLLSPRQHLLALSAASKAGLPPEFVLSVLEAQIQHDYDAIDMFEDTVMKSVLAEFDLAQSSVPLMGGPDAVAYPSVVSSYFLLLSTRLDLSLGLGQVRISTASNAESSSFGEQWIPLSSSNLEVIRGLETDQGNIYYVAGYLQQLTEQRTGHSGPYDPLPLNDMQIIYGAYRSGIDNYGSVNEFRQWKVPGPLGQLITSAMVERYSTVK